MYIVKVDSQKEFQIEIRGEHFVLDGKNYGLDFVQNGLNKFLVYRDSKVHELEVIDILKDEKEVVLKINGKATRAKVSSELDLMLQKLGLDQRASSQIKDLKAPMPGLILKINVSAGQEVKKGDSLLVLEAMKMENVIKATGDATVKHIKVNEKQSVEKNEVLIEFGTSD